MTVFHDSSTKNRKKKKNKTGYHDDCILHTEMQLKFRSFVSMFQEVEGDERGADCPVFGCGPWASVDCKMRSTSDCRETRSPVNYLSPFHDGIGILIKT